MSPAEQIAQELAKARLEEDLCDFDLRCEQLTIQVHRIVISVQSAVLRKACAASIKKNLLWDYYRTDCSPTCLIKMVDYFYSGDYDTSDLDLDNELVAHLRFHANMLVTADKHQAPGLQRAAEGKFRAFVATSDGVELIRAIPAIHNLLQEGRPQPQTFACKAFRDHFPKMMPTPEIIKAMDDTYRTVPSFFLGMTVGSLGTGLTPPLEAKCGHCGLVAVDLEEEKCANCRSLVSKKK